MNLSKLRPCPECGGQERVEVELLTGEGFVLRQTRRKVPFLSSGNRTDVRVATCLTCGYTAFFARNQENLRPDPKRP